MRAVARRSSSSTGTGWSPAPRPAPTVSVLPSPISPMKRHLVVHQALDARDRRASSLTKYGKLISMWPASASRRSVISRQHGAERFDRDLALVPLQDLDEARHVRALEVVRQVHVHVEVGDGVLLAGRAVLDPHRVADVLDADPVDGELARVGAALHVFDPRTALAVDGRSWQRPTGVRTVVILVATGTGYTPLPRRRERSELMQAAHWPCVRGASAASRTLAFRASPTSARCWRQAALHRGPRRPGSPRASRAR